MWNDILTEARLRRRSGQKWSLFAADVLPAWVADMDFEIAEPIRAALAERVATGDLGYPMSAARNGIPELFVERVKARFGWSIQARDVVILSDVVQGLYLGLETLSARGDGVVIQTPIYPPFLHAAAETARRAVICPLQMSTKGYVIDIDALAHAIDDGTRVLMLCNPHNPSGRAFTHGELTELAELACRRDLIVLSDEIHADLILDPVPHIPIAALGPEIAARTVTLMSASKAFNIAGLCLAFAHFGSSELKRRFERVPPHARGGTNTLALAAVHAAWNAGQPWLDRVLRDLRANRDRVTAHVRSQWPRVRHVPPEATYLAWLDVRALALPGDPFQHVLDHARVALGDGKAFGLQGEGFLRLNFATSGGLLDEILARLDAAFAGA